MIFDLLDKVYFPKLVVVLFFSVGRFFGMDPTDLVLEGVSPKTKVYLLYCYGFSKVLLASTDRTL